VVLKVFEQIKKNMVAARDLQSRMPQPLLFYYKMRNIISVYTTLLNYLLCKQSGRQRSESQN